MTHSPGSGNDSPYASAYDAATLPAPLSGDTRRQAHATITGYVYQAWRSIDAWVRLRAHDAVIYLEGAEDFDEVSDSSAITSQVRHTSTPISLGNVKARESLESFWQLVNDEPNRRIEFHYLTTSTAASERGLSIDGLNGIEAWSVARTNPSVAAELIRFLTESLPLESELRVYLIGATVAQAQENLFSRFHWLTDQPGIETMRRTVEARLSALLLSQQRPLRFVKLVSSSLYDFFWEAARRDSIERRRLSPADLDRIISEVAEIEVSTLTRDWGPLAGAFTSERALLDFYSRRVPVPPEPLLARPELVGQVQDLVRTRRVALLTGTVHKGKTTLAQLAAAALCPDARWVMLSEQSPTSVDRLLMALADVIDRGEAPPLVILDDLDVSPSAHRIYRHSLTFCLQRASEAGVSLMITARGTSSSAIVPEDFSALQLLDVPDLEHAEIESLCYEHGCSSEYASSWATLITSGTGGHPAFVRVRIAELVSRGWPRPHMGDVMNQSIAVSSERERARSLLRETVSPSIAELLYSMSEASVPLARSVAVRLAEMIPGLSNPGDAVDAQVGQWLERVEEGDLRTTVLLRHSAGQAWTPAQLQANHLRIFDALVQKSPASPAEAASLLFHSFLGRDAGRQTYIAKILLTLENEEARQQVNQHLTWLTVVGLEPGQTITEFPGTDVLIRHLQFNVASTLDSELITNICARWAESVERLDGEARDATRALMWIQFAVSQNQRVSIRYRLDALEGLQFSADEASVLWRRDVATAFFRGGLASTAGIPTTARPGQIILLNATKVVRSLESLSILVDWLEHRATPEIRSDFDAMLEWDIVQMSGAFVQTAWAAQHEDTTDWTLWLALFDRMREISITTGLQRFGREAAKAKAIVLSEHIGEPAAAVQAITQAVADFGSSPVIEEQSVNTLFQNGDYAGALAIYQNARVNGLSSAWDPFARRRAAISAVRLDQHGVAETIFRDAAEAIEPGSFEVTRVGLFFDAAAAASSGGMHTTSAIDLAKGIAALPPNASSENNEALEAVQRVGMTFVTDASKRVWNPSSSTSGMEPGLASRPGLSMGITPGQQFRTSWLIVNVLVFSASLNGLLPEQKAQAVELGYSTFPSVRYSSSIARLTASFAAAATDDFVGALIALDGELSNMTALTHGVARPNPAEPAPAIHTTPMPERLTSLIYAGVACCGPNLLETIQNWRNDATVALGSDARLVVFFDEVIAGATASSLSQAAWMPQNSLSRRCGAAARRLWFTEEIAEGFRTQSFLLVAMLDLGSDSSQSMFARHLARQWAAWWRARLATGRFQFVSAFVPRLETTLDAIERGEAGLRELRTATAAASGQPLTELDQQLV